MVDTAQQTQSTATHCGVCRRFALVGERLLPFHDGRSDRRVHVCELCRGRAQSRGWASAGEPERRGGVGVRIHAGERAGSDGRAGSDEQWLDEGDVESEDDVVADDVDPEEEPDATRGVDHDADTGSYRRVDAQTASPAARAPRADAPAHLLEQLRHQQVEIAQLRRELEPGRRADEQHTLRRQADQIRELRERITELGAQVQRLQQARQAETSPAHMCALALTAFNQSEDLDRMARIARTLGDPEICVRDAGPGIPRRIHITFAWEIAWYQFEVKLDLGTARASVHARGNGGDPTTLPAEQRRANARWRESGVVLA